MTLPPLFAAHARPGLRRLMLLASLGAAIAGPAAAQAAATAPVPALHWKPCAERGEEGFDCATARVPLDYARPRGRTIDLALIRHKATDPAHRIGTLFFNPGGPGGPGVASLILYYNAPTTPAPIIFPIKVRERFDIVSWDPRGVGKSTSVLCFATREEERKRILALGIGVPETREQQKAWLEGWADIARHCGKSKTADLLAHVSTADTARDLDLLRQAVGDEKLTYQGNSYGTFLAAVYANLFPHKVRAMVLLGNIDPDAYTNLGHDNPRLDVSLRRGVELGTAGTLDAFLELCGRASTQQCAFSAGSAAATKAKWESLVEALRKRPVVVGDVTYDTDLVITLAVISLYDISPGFVGYDWDWLAKLSQALWERSTNPHDYPPFYNTPGGQEAVQALAVGCGEAPNPRDSDAYFALADLATIKAGAVGPYWVWRDSECAAWPARAADPYNGPWNRRTANPILLINNTYDPAVPLSEAVALQKALADARLLEIEGYGHADAAVPSTCADRFVSAYFIDGSLPPKGAMCQQDWAPFTRHTRNAAANLP